LPLATEHSLRTILDGLLVVVQACASKFIDTFGADISRHPGYRQALIEASIATNAALDAFSIQKEFGSKDPGELQAVYGVYLLETRQVWAPRVNGSKEIGLAAAPGNAAGFAELGSTLLQSQRILSFIDVKQ
jgi:carbonic anhydrase